MAQTKDREITIEADRAFFISADQHVKVGEQVTLREGVARQICGTGRAHVVDGKRSTKRADPPASS